MRDRIGNMLWGIVFIVIGIGFLGNVLWGWHFELFFDGWWTLFIIVPCGISIVQRGPRTGNMIGIAVGILLLLSETYDMYYFGELIIPVIFIILGIRIIFRNNNFSNQGSNTYSDSSTQSNHYSNTDSQEDSTKHIHNDKFQYQRRNYVKSQATAVFSSKVIDFSNQLFEGITLNSVLGSITLDLRNAEIKEGAFIDIAAVLGGVDIIVPSDVEVKVQQVPILGGVTNKRGAGVITSTVYLNATCILGGVTIK